MDLGSGFSICLQRFRTWKSPGKTCVVWGWYTSACNCLRTKSWEWYKRWWRSNYLLCSSWYCKQSNICSILRCFTGKALVWSLQDLRNTMVWSFLYQKRCMRNCLETRFKEIWDIAQFDRNPQNAGSRLRQNIHMLQRCLVIPISYFPRSWTLPQTSPSGLLYISHAFSIL